MQVSYCVRERKPCVSWVEIYFKDCLCNINDHFSFAFGLISLVCWGVAEIPQIITNFRTKSSHGVSLAFLLTWIAGDVFNLVGCLLEPATLPTQFYTALLYTASTVVLVWQSVYYDHFCKWRKRRSKIKSTQTGDEEKQPLTQKSVDTSIPIPKSTQRKEFYYTSARSLAGSDTPPFRGLLRRPRSGPSALGADDSGSSSEDETVQVSFNRTVSQPRPIPRSAGYGTFLATSISFPVQTKGLTDANLRRFTARRLLHEQGMDSAYGQWLGWLMAAIYMGGRLPQIWLNMKRGSVEGLNPLMFVFALIANVTYVASILVRTTEWDKIKANMPWLLDAVVCVVLDLFIILQYIYYRYFNSRETYKEGAKSSSR